jgi:hypothetical protein
MEQEQPETLTLMVAVFERKLVAQQQHTFMSLLMMI